MTMGLPSKSDSVSGLSQDSRLAALVRGIGHVLLMKVDPEAAAALNLSGFVPGHGTRTLDAAPGDESADTRGQS